jgi:hypothetical protein
VTGDRIKPLPAGVRPFSQTTWAPYPAATFLVLPLSADFPPRSAAYPFFPAKAKCVTSPSAVMPIASPLLIVILPSPISSVLGNSTSEQTSNRGAQHMAEGVKQVAETRDSLQVQGRDSFLGELKQARRALLSHGPIFLKNGGTLGGKYGGCWRTKSF